jgi:hypothetical protein
MPFVFAAYPLHAEENEARQKISLEIVGAFALACLWLERWWWMMRRWSLFCFYSFRLSVLLLVVLSCGALPCGARVVINEVYYDHPGKDEGWEFVEIHNAGDEPLDLSLWSLEFLDGASLRRTTVWTAPPGIVIAPGEFLCIAGSARNPAPGLLLKGTLGNGPDAVRLISSSGVADLVGYGACASSDLYESSPACAVAAGSSLARRPDGYDSDANGTDFVASAPTPGRRNFFQRDIGLRFAGDGSLPCRGARFPVRVMVDNHGLSPFTGGASILTEVNAGGASSSARSELGLDLAVSATDSFDLMLDAPPADRFLVRAYFDEAPDENPSDDSALVSVASSPGVIVINEIMYRPGEGMSEWIELENRSAEECNLASWTICDATGSRRLISTGDFMVARGAFAILAKDSAAFAREFPACAASVKSLEDGWPSLNDADRGDVADIVALRDRLGVLVERISYRDLLGLERGRSIERISPDVCGDRDGGIWHRCAARSGATPGRENSALIEGMPRRHGIAVSPNPLCLSRDRFAAITGDLGEGESGFLIRIFDLAGREVRRIFGEIGGARVFSCRWDGRANDNSLVRTGLYVCCVEFVGTGGGVCRREKECVAVAGD